MKCLFLLPLGLALAACHPGQPCPTCENAADDAPVDLGSISDLPCGGADLRIDNANCGACGNECTVLLEGTAYEAGSCHDGECGPLWQPRTWSEPTPITCDEICASYGDPMPLSCAVRGCSGMTAFVCDSIIGQPCATITEGTFAELDFTGECDQPIPWPENAAQLDVPVIYCCCEVVS